MAEVNAKDLTTKTAPASTDSMLLFGTSTNEGAKITVDNLANNILERLTTKTFANQVGGSSAATILAQLATLNSNSKVWTTIVNGPYTTSEAGAYQYTGISFRPSNSGFAVVQGSYTNVAVTGLSINSGSGSMNSTLSHEETTVNGGLTVTAFLQAHTTYYLWAKTSTAGTNNIRVYFLSLKDTTDELATASTTATVNEGI